MDFVGGVYCIHVKDIGTYYGESVNISKRWAVHRKKLYSGKHHCVRLRAAFREYGMGVFEFKILAQSALLDKHVELRTALEQTFIKQDPHALNTAHNDTHITPECMPSKAEYRDRILILRRVGKKNWAKVFDENGKYLGIEPLSKNFRLGKFKTKGYMLVRVK